MIHKASEKHKEQIITLWNKAFGDKAESVRTYLDTILEYIFVYADEDTVKGMMTVLPVSLEKKNGGYIYAVATDEKFRGQGVCRTLIESVKANKNYDFLVLVPQNEGLFALYEKMEFKKSAAERKKEMYIADDIKSEALMEEITAGEYESVRNDYFGEENIIKWGEEMLSFSQKMYNGKFYKVTSEDEKESYAFLYATKESVVIKELLSQTPDQAAECIGRSFGVGKVVYSFPDKCGNPDYMIYGERENGLYFGIYLD